LILTIRFKATENLIEIFRDDQHRTLTCDINQDALSLVSSFGLISTLSNAFLLCLKLVETFSFAKGTQRDQKEIKVRGYAILFFT